MIGRMQSLCLLSVGAALILWQCSGVAAAPAEADFESQAEQILDATGVKGGLIVHLGCGGGRLTAALRADDSYLVHGLDTDAAQVAEARRYIRSKGLYGAVSVEAFDGKRLPYADNLVNLLVAEERGGVSEQEIMRVLAPLGVAWIKAGGKWHKTTRPWPKEIDEWTHWLHGPDGNAVAEDVLVGPPRHLQWIEKPIWLKHHNSTISLSAMVSARGRIFYIINENPPGIFGLPQQWVLQARDGFNGKLLWKKNIADWGWSSWVGQGKGSSSRFDQPADLQRRLVAVGDYVYAALGTGAPLSRLDAADGKIINSYAGTENVSEVLYCDGKLIVSVHCPAEGNVRLLDKSILVFDAESAQLLWKKGPIKGVAGKTNELRKYTSLYLAASAEKLFYVNAESVTCRDLATGSELWKMARPPRQNKIYGYASVYTPDQCSLVAYRDTLLFGQTAAISKFPWNEPVPVTLQALSTDTGDKLWEFECGSWSYGSPVDIFAVDDVVWVHTLDDYSVVALDISTGKVRRKFSASDAMNSAHHHRCYRNKATSNYILTARRGVEFIDLDSGRNLLNHWVRGACLYGILPCNGLLYAPPHPCMCYATAKINGFAALAAQRQAVPNETGNRLEKGAAYGKVNPSQGDPDDWSTFRRDPARSGSTTAKVPAELEEIWRAGIGGKISAVTAAAGKVFAASVDSHAIFAFEEASGSQLWRYTTGGPVDSPPTFHKGMVLAGSADGWVYCLRAKDGELVWRFQAAPDDVRICAFGRLASPWPVHGSVLIRDNVAYVSAGRSSFLDGGIRLYALDPATGKVLQERIIFAPDPETGEGRFDASLRYDMPPDSSGTLSDILVSEGPYIYMRHTKIDPADFGRDFEAQMPKAEIEAFYKQKQTGKTLDFGPQVVSTAGLLDDSWFNQTFWSYARASHSRILVFDEQFTYGLKAFAGGSSRHVRSKFTVGANKYVLFADNRQNGKRSWSIEIPVRVTALVAAGDSVFAAGTPDEVPSDDPWAAYEGRRGGLLWVISKKDGRKLAEYKLDSPPVWNGMAAARRRLYVATKKGEVICYGRQQK